ncbi:MAG: response regulator [Methylacidiphilales bacterium]|nr:response regulator [Candidatus Methylacidiphilales bacterium]
MIRETEQSDLDHILELVRLQAALIRGHSASAENHRDILKANGECDERLDALPSWRQSFSFTQREKAALALCESMMVDESQELSRNEIKNARCHFEISEMVRLTLAIAAVNDWIDLHSNPPVRVLVIEDDPQDQELLSWELRRVNMEENVTFLPDGQAALDLLTDPKAESFRPDLVAIFLDLHLPGLHGVELLRRLRALPGMQHFPIVVMTASSDPEDREECLRLGVTDYIQKPITYKSFSHLVANLFHKVAA